MRKLQFSIVLLVIAFTVSCSNSEEKKTEKKEEVKKEFVYSADKTELEWTAFKTTKKVPVKGTFQEMMVKNVSQSNSVEELISSSTFEINTSSVFSNNDSRDYLLKEFFFGIMLNTEKITGSFKDVEGGKGIVLIKMNDVEYANPFVYEQKEGLVKISTKIDLANWNALASVESINEKCLDLHRGADGVSKTWSEVDVVIVSALK